MKIPLLFFVAFTFAVLVLWYGVKPMVKASADRTAREMLSSGEPLYTSSGRALSQQEREAILAKLNAPPTH